MVSNVIQFIVEHQALFASFAVALIDFLIGLNPNWKSNNLLHSVQLFLKNILGKPELPPK